MCFNYSLAKFQKYIEERFDARFAYDYFNPVFHVKADQKRFMPVICRENPGIISPYEWRLIPTWTKDLIDANKRREGTYNATCERIFEAPSYRNLIYKNRCLIPADGFFEWHLADNGKKYPFYLKLKTRDAFAFAGIYSNWIDTQTNLTYNTFSIITTPANSVLSLIHNTKKRMPLILPRSKEKDWLNPLLKKEEITAFFIPYDNDDLTAYPVDKKNILTGADNESVIDKVHYEELIGFD